MRTNYFNNCNSLDEVKKRYKELAMLHHPDKGGNTATMQAINAEYAAIIRNPLFECEPQTKEQQEESLRYPEIINQLIGLEGLIIELIGDWIWLSGNTFPYRTQLKQIGFYFAPKKVMWYYRPADYKSSNKLPKTIEAIRDKYGSEKIFYAKKKFELNN